MGRVSGGPGEGQGEGQEDQIEVKDLGPLKGLIRPFDLIRPFKGLIRPFKSLIRPFKGLIRPFKGPYKAL